MSTGETTTFIYVHLNLYSKYGIHFVMSNSLALLHAFMQFSKVYACVCVCVCVLCVTVWRGEDFANINAKQAKGGGGTRTSEGKRHKCAAEEEEDKKTEQASV